MIVMMMEYVMLMRLQVAKILQRVITMRLQLMKVVVHMQMIIMIVLVTVYQM